MHFCQTTRPVTKFGTVTTKSKSEIKMKKVLLLGDSIRMGYCNFVKSELAGSAEVCFPAENCRFTQYTLVSLRNWLKETGIPREEIELVHWNNGHWDVAHFHDDELPLNTPELYGIMLERIYCHLRKFCPNAQIVFALTTPVTSTKGPAGNPRSNSEIEKYNAVAVEVMNKLGVRINDLYSLTKESISDDLYADFCHFTPEGYQILGKQVIKVIKETLDMP